MEWCQALFYLYTLSGEFSKNVSLYYHLGHLFGYSGEELMILLLYSHFNYRLSLYSILMAKYLTTPSFPLFSLQLHQHMLTLGLDTYYFQTLTNLHLTQIFWPDHALHAARHLNIPSETSIVNKSKNPKMNYTIDTLWVLLKHLINDIQDRCIDYDSQITFTRKKLPHYIRFKVHYTRCFSPQFIIKTIDDLYEIASYLELSLLWP